MTENEAIKEIKHEVCNEKGIARLCHDECMRGKENCEFSMAIEALEEIQQYRAIGTVEECREAREKQRAKKPILCMNEKSGMFVDYADGHGEYKTQMNNWWRCPCCNEVVGQRVIVHKHIYDQRKKNYCEKCGQSILWEEEQC